MQRLKALAALALTAFFAVAGSFHHHPIPKPSHDHAGFCSAASNGIAFESCVLCKAAHTAVHLAAVGTAAATLDASARCVESRPAAAAAGRSLLRDSRAPPAV